MIARLLGLSIPAWVYELVLGVALLGGAVMYLEHRGAQGEIAKLKASSARLFTQTQHEIAVETRQHAADVAANQEKLDAALAANTDLQSELAQRVRDFDTYRRAHTPVARAGSQPAPASGGECGAQSCGDLTERLAERGNELAFSVGELSATLRSCQRDRDSLTGLPK